MISKRSKVSKFDRLVLSCKIVFTSLSFPGELNRAICWYLSCDRYWEDTKRQQRHTPWYLLTIFLIVLFSSIYACYYIIWVLFKYVRWIIFIRIKVVSQFIIDFYLHKLKECDKSIYQRDDCRHICSRACMIKDEIPRNGNILNSCNNNDSPTLFTRNIV